MSDEEIIDVEPIDDEKDEVTGAEIVHQPLGQVSIYQSSDPKAQLDEARARAAVLVEVVREQGLAKVFREGSKPHVFVEGWQFLASQFGLIPEIEWTKELGDGAGWEARASLRRLSDGQIISHADGECRSDENNWRGRDSYAIRSMAQTRAVSKVCRVALSSVMVMAGYNATPAEEMDGFSSGYSAPSPYDDAEGPASPDDPHCPACLQEFGTLVAVTGPHDRKPYWRCTAKPANCAGRRTHNGKEYSWSGWHKSFENSVADWGGGVITGEAKTVVIDGNTRDNRTGYIVHEIMETAGLESRSEAEVLVKPGLSVALEEGHVDGKAALGGPPSDPPTDEEMKVIVRNLTQGEADMVVATAASLMPK